MISNSAIKAGYDDSSDSDQEARTLEDIEIENFDMSGS